MLFRWAGLQLHCALAQATSLLRNAFAQADCRGEAMLRPLEEARDSSPTTHTVPPVSFVSPRLTGLSRGGRHRSDRGVRERLLSTPNRVPPPLGRRRASTRHRRIDGGASVRAPILEGVSLRHIKIPFMAATGGELTPPPSMSELAIECILEQVENEPSFANLEKEFTSQTSREYMLRNQLGEWCKSLQQCALVGAHKPPRLYSPLHHLARAHAHVYVSAVPLPLALNKLQTAGICSPALLSLAPS